MKDTLTTSQIADRLAEDKNASFSYAGAHALAEYLEEIENDTGEEMEFDGVVIRCDFSEYPSALEAIKDYNFEPDEDDDENEQEKAAINWLQEQTQVIEFDGGVIIQAF